MLHQRRSQLAGLIVTSEPGYALAFRLFPELVLFMFSSNICLWLVVHCVKFMFSSLKKKLAAYLKCPTEGLLSTCQENHPNFIKPINTPKVTSPMTITIRILPHFSVIELKV
jgi:hypothetical protein